MTITFTLRYATQFGEQVYLHLSQNGVTRLIPMRFADAQNWRIELATPTADLEYHFSIRDDSEQILREELRSRTLALLPVAHQTTVHLIDEWDMPNFPEHFLVNKVLANIKSKGSIPQLGEKIRVYYAVQIDTVPPQFKFFVNNAAYFRKDVVRYFEKAIQKAFDLEGLPVIIHIEGKKREKREK